MLCKEFRILFSTCLALQVDIVCGDGNQPWYFRPRKNKTDRTDPTGETHPKPLNGLINTVARIEVARLNQGHPVYERVAMEYLDDNAYVIAANRKAAAYDARGCCSIQLFCYGKPNQQHPERQSERVKLKTDCE